MRFPSIIRRTVALLAAFGLTLQAASAEKITTKEAEAIAKEAYVYSFPIVTGYKTLHVYTVDLMGI